MDSAYYILGQRRAKAAGDAALKALIERTAGDTFIIPHTVTTIGRYAFARCSVTDFVVPDTVETILNNAFQDCQSLTTITIGSGVRSISSYVFYASNLLARAFLRPSTPPTLAATNAFPDDVKFIIPNDEDLLAAYEVATNWTGLFNNFYTAADALEAEIITQEEYDRFLEGLDND